MLPNSNAAPSDGSISGGSSRILIADDDQSVCLLLRYSLQAKGYQVQTASDGRQAFEMIREQPFDLVITDVRMPRMDGIQLLKRIKSFDPDLPVLVLSAYPTLELAVEATKLGAYNYIRKPVDNTQFQIMVRNVLDHRAKDQISQIFLRRDHPGESRHGMVGSSDAMRWVLQRLERIARYNTPVLIVGESGTGKELVARAIHQASPRHAGPFVAFNGAGIVDSLFESALFGHVKGAFTGATSNHKGLLEEAHKGTLFMDEIGEMSPTNQAKLLRVLETYEVQPVGASRHKKVDVRILAATNRDPAAAIEQGELRLDLYYRLGGLVLELPPLRKREGDVRLLAAHFLSSICRENQDLDIRGFAPEAMAALESYDWPGNVRELRRAVESSAVMATSNWITLPDLPPTIVRNRRTNPPSTPPPSPDEPGKSSTLNTTLSLAEVERRHIARVLDMARGNKTRAAQVLGISRHALYRVMKKHGLG